MDADLAELWPEVEGESGMVTMVGAGCLNERLDGLAAMRLDHRLAGAEGGAAVEWGASLARLRALPPRVVAMADECAEVRKEGFKGLRISTKTGTEGSKCVSYGRIRGELREGSEG